MSATLSLYRALTGGAGAIAAPLGRLLTPGGSAWRARFGGAEGAELAAGGPWIHAASMGEALGAIRWAGALIASGYRAPLFVTTRTASGLARVRRDGRANVVGAMAPLDLPQAVRAVLRDLVPMRLDLIETELWPNLILEAHRAGIPVVAASATVSARTAGRLRSLGLAGEPLFGSLYVLAQSERHAARFRSLGVADDRCVVIGDLKADQPGGANGDAAIDSPSDPLSDPEPRRLLLFASLRPGEESAAVAVAAMLAARRDAGAWRFIVAPRHDRGLPLLKRAFARAGIRTEVRDESTRGEGSVLAWADRAATAGESWRVGLLATRGELSELFPHARAALVGGTFAPWGGHNVLEPAASGCPVIVGPHHEEVESGVALLLEHEGGAVATDAAVAAATLSRWLDEPAAARALKALAAARAAAGAARRGLDAIAAWGLEP
jgi:3-deoxy-D-manno-octulosonic-acid transferase